MVQSHLGEVAALVTTLCWAITAISFEMAGKKVGSLSVNYIRLVIGFILISFFTFFTRGSLLPLDASTNAWIWLSISGFIGFFLGDMFLFQSYLEIGSRISMLVMATSPPITALLGYVFMRERLRYIDFIGMAITLIGIAIVVLNKNPDEKKIKLSHSFKGLVFAFLGALGQGLGLIFSKMGMGEYNPFAATQIRIISGFVGFTILFIVMNKWKSLKNALKDPKAMFGISIGSIFGPFLGVSFSLISLKYTSVGISSTITSIVPVIIIPFSIIFLKEKIRFKELIGAVITVVGVSVLFI
ncbi:MAG: DMT family transporter [Tissierellales bacterium]